MFHSFAVKLSVLLNFYYMKGEQRTKSYHVRISFDYV